MIVPAKVVKLKNGKEIILRSPAPEDAGNFLGFMKTLFSESWENLNHNSDKWDNFPIDKEQKVLADSNSSMNSFMISAFDGDNIIGNIGITGEDKPFHKFNAQLGLGIKKEFHGLGLGASLIDYSIQNCRNMGIHRIELKVRAFNEQGISLYEKMGFRQVGVFKEVAFIKGSFFDEYLYERLL